MAEGNTLARLLAAGDFVVTAEVTPPLSADAGTLIAKAAPLKGLADAVNVTDAAGARAAMSSFAAAAILVREGIEPVLQLTCRDRNRIAIAGDLIGAAAQGVHNMLVLHGDAPEGGDQPEAKPVHDLDSRAVMNLARQMRDQGTLPSGRRIEPPPRLFIGGADTPFDPPPDWQPKGLVAKAEAGADFAQTQFCFDPAVAGRYMARLAEAGLTERIKVILGVGPLASARSARWMNDTLHGVTVPGAVIERLERAADQAAEGRKLCVELIQGLREIPGVAGVHVMAPLQGAEAIAQVIEASGVLKARAG
ncbi:MAG: methylenetetrahydrofolate reductase [Rhodospirillales bacterium]|nr:methylenetetrahydrofolate reductase [Rhodospirillales bacterium]